MANHSFAYMHMAYGKVLDQHMVDMADRGASTVNICASEYQQRYNPEGIKLAVKAAHRVGLQSFLDPWGAYDVFGGEPPSIFLAQGGKPCLGNPAFLADLRRTVECWALSGADGGFWDEPHLKCGCCSTIDLLDFVTTLAHAKGLRNNANVPHFHWFFLQGAAELKTVDIIGTNSYYDIPNGHINAGYRDAEIQVKENAERLSALGQQFGKETEIFLQGFKHIMMRGHENDRVADWIQPCADAARAGGVTNLAFWAYDIESLSSLWANGRQDECANVLNAATAVFHQP